MGKHNQGESRSSIDLNKNQYAEILTEILLQGTEDKQIQLHKTTRLFHIIWRVLSNKCCR